MGIHVYVNILSRNAWLYFVTYKYELKNQKKVFFLFVIDQITITETTKGAYKYIEEIFKYFLNLYICEYLTHFLSTFILLMFQIEHAYICVDKADLIRVVAIVALLVSP